MATTPAANAFSPASTTLVATGQHNSSPDSGTYLMSGSPVKRRQSTEYRPKIISTIGQRPACLVSASITYVGNDEIYAFGGFDQYTDEVYNHVLRLDLKTRQWALVDNYGDIPGVRMGHTASLWNGDKVVIFGGENEHRSYLNDLMVFDVKTAHWTQPDIRGPTPKGRARHSAVVDDDKLYIIGGMSGTDNNTVLDEFCFLDLKKWEWSRTWRFVPRYDHTSWVYGGRIWVFGGLTQGMQRMNDIWWLDPKKSPAYENAGSFAHDHARSYMRPPRHQSVSAHAPPSVAGISYAANSSSVQTQQIVSPIRKLPMAPGAISSLKFMSGPNIPAQSLGTHFNAFSSGCLIDFATPGLEESGVVETSLAILELGTMRWEKLAEGRDLFNPNYRWHYCAMNQEGTEAWLLGCSADQGNVNNGTEYLSDVLHIDLSKFGLVGNTAHVDNPFEKHSLPASDAHLTSHLSGLGADFASKFDIAPEQGGGADFIVTSEDDSVVLLDDDDETEISSQEAHRKSRPIHVHRLILEARWPHFANMINHEMLEFHSKKLHMPEPFSVVRSFLYYLYSDSICFDPRINGPTLNDVAGMIVLADCYVMPRLRLLCRARLSRELDIEHAAHIWERAGVANEDWLRKKAARFILTNWGRVVRTRGFLSLKHTSMAELCQETDTEARVVGAEELEFVGGLGSGRLTGFGMVESRGSVSSRSHRTGSMGIHDDDVDDDEDEEMDNV